MDTLQHGRLEYCPRHKKVKTNPHLRAITSIKRQPTVLYGMLVYL